MPNPTAHKPYLPGWVVALLLLGGLGVGLGIYWSLQDRDTRHVAATETMLISTITVEKTTFTKSIRIGGTVGARNFATIRAPRMQGGRDRGGGDALTIQFLVEPGSIVQKGDIVAEFESKRTQDVLAGYESVLAQTKAKVGARKAEILIATETLRQDFRSTKAEAEKAELDLLTAEVRSAIQAEIFSLLAHEGHASSEQLEEEIGLQELANRAESRSLEISVEQDRKRMERTRGDLERMKVRTPVAGLVVIETTFSRGNFQQAAAGDQLNAGAYFMRVVDLSNMAVFASLNQADSQMVRLGAPVRVKLDAYPDVTFDGRLSSVGAMAVTGGGGSHRGPPGARGSRTEWVKQVPVEIEILGSDERIKPDLSASADVIVEELEGALVVPRAALRTSGRATVVYVQRDDDFFEREVTVESLSDTQAVISSGLREGEVIAAQTLLRESAVVSRRLTLGASRSP